MAHSHNGTAQLICPACNYGPFTRNNYFTGKLLVERDFTDETHFHMEKLRHHEQLLHGWGVVCGLKVKPHPNEACRDRFVCVEPGSAVDCCGHDIIVSEEHCVDITQFPEIKALKSNNDKEPHKLQICVRFRECPTEDIPVLYDDCGCDDTKCAPNRILESYEIGVLVDPPSPPDSLHAPQLAWNNSVTLLADVSRIALHDASHRLYLLVGDDVYQVDTTTPIVGPNFHLAAKGLEIAISNSGDHLFVVTEPPAGFRQLVVVKTSDMSQVRVLDIDNSVNSDIRLAVASDDRLIVLVRAAGDVLIWMETELTGTATPSARTPVNLASTNLQSLVVGNDAQHAYAVGTGSNNVIKVVNTTGAGSPGSDITVLPPTARPTGIAVVRSTSPDLLAIIDQAGKKLYLVGLNPLALLGNAQNPGVVLAHPPVGLAVSPGGHWAYVLEQESGGKSFVQAVDLFRLSQNQAVLATLPLPVGDASQQIVVSASGALLYIPYLGATANAFDGGVAKIEIKNLACDDLLWEHLNGCPHCDVPNCVVLATIENYQLGDRIDEQTDPPADPAQDATNKIARIDNRNGRRLLPSTQVLTELVECLLEHGVGEGGTQGPPGTPGAKGDPGLGLEEGLTRIEALSWTHNGNHVVATGDPNRFFVNVTMFNGSTVPGIVIGFTDEVQVRNTIDADHVFQVLVDHRTADGVRRGLVCRCAIRGRAIPVNLNLDHGKIVVNAAGHIDFASEALEGEARGVAFLLDQTFPIAKEIVNGKVNDLWIILRGDFVLDKNRKAIDAEFARAQLPTGDRPSGSKVGIQGGLFESWFTVKA